MPCASAKPKKHTFVRASAKAQGGPAVRPRNRLPEEAKDTESQALGISLSADTPPLPTPQEVVQHHIFLANQEQGGS